MPENRFRDTSLDFDERVSALLAELTTEEKLGLLTTHMNAVPRLGIKEFWIGAEVARGLVCRDPQGEYPSTVFPEPFGLAATFDTDVMKRMGEVTGVENRIYTQKGKSSLCVWGPTVDLERDPRWGRNEEAYGEDPVPCRNHGGSVHQRNGWLRRKVHAGHSYAQALLRQQQREHPRKLQRECPDAAEA